MSIFSFLNPLTPFIAAAERAYEKRLQASNDAERIAAEKEISFWQERVDLAQTASQHDKWWSPRSLMGFSVSLYVGKIIVWDTVLGMGVTAYPGEHVTFIVMTVIGFYFVSRGAESIATVIASAISRRGSK